jgi:exodeoxyribonuclease VII small subunit
MSDSGDPSPAHPSPASLDSAESSLLDPDGGTPLDAAAGLSYEQASARIEEIIRRLDSGEAGLRETLELVREGRGLIEYCAGELEAVGQGLEQLRLDELVVRLQQDAAAASRASGEDRPA